MEKEMGLKELEMVTGGNGQEMMELYLIAKEHDSDEFSKHSSMFRSKETDIKKYLKGRWQIDAAFNIDTKAKATYTNGGKNLRHVQVVNRLRRKLGLM